MMPFPIDKNSYHELYDDFQKLDTVASTGLWQSVNDGATGTLALVAATVDGRINIPTAAAANDYQLLATQQKIFKFAANKPLWFEATVQCTEANTNNANWAVGLSSITTTGFMTDTNGGLPATWDGAVWYKTGGALALGFASSAASSAVTKVTPNVTPNDTATYASATDYTLGFHFDPNDGTTGYITPYYNGKPCLTTGGVIYRQPIALSGLGTMYPILTMKAGSTSAETLQVDRVWVLQKR